MRIGIISDTHNSIPLSIEKVFKETDLILHAGDIGSQEILNRLKSITNVQAVCGNTDIYTLSENLPSQITFKVEGMIILMLHDIGSINSFLWRIRKENFQPLPQIIIYGHTHSPIFQKINNIYFLNPGSAGKPKTGQRATVMILTIKKGQIAGNQFIELP